jgi:6-phosphogluconolactonase
MFSLIVLFAFMGLCNNVGAFMSFSPGLRAVPAGRIKTLCQRAATLRIEKDEMAVGRALCSILESEYHHAISEKGTFVFGISGGSMLKMLSHLKGHSKIDWSLCTMAFVSHRCVALDDDAATYHKARPLFLQSWMDQGLHVLTPTGTMDAEREADAYESQLAALPSRVLPHSSEGYPMFDLLLIGVGIDGHVGSIYPHSYDDVHSKRVVVPVTEPADKPVKISLSLKAMTTAKSQVIACAGKSTKAPLGKAEAMVRALEHQGETAMSFPASVFRDRATFLIDEDSAVLLKSKTVP